MVKRWIGPIVLVALLSAGLAAALPSAAGADPTAIPAAPVSAGTTGPGRTSTVSVLGWSQGPAFPAPFATRWDFSSAYFPPLNEVVLFGGAPDSLTESFYNDTWVYRSGAWTQGPAAPAGLTPRGGTAMAYLPAIGKIVLFGGAGTSWPPYNETWLFDGAAWTQGPAAPAGLLGRTGSQMVSDPDIDKLVLVSGSGVLPYTDTWFFDGAAWTKGPNAPAGMAPRVFFGMSYDPFLHKVVVAGGTGTNDTWLFDGSAWSAGPKLAPGPKERIRMDYDPQLGGDVIFGGLGPGRPTYLFWVFKAGQWLQVKKTAGAAWPTAQADSAVVWNPDEDSLMVFQGIRTSGGTGGPQPMNETWFYHQPAGSNLFSTGGTPGSVTQVRGQGFHPTEQVDVRFDSKTGALLGTVTTDGNGDFPNTSFTLPSPLAGGTRTIYGVGRSSAIVGTGTLAVSPKGDISPSRVGAGDATTFSGLGFVPGETVSASFPGGTVAKGTAGTNGSVSINVFSPPEPQPGDDLTATAPSGSVTHGYSTVSRFASPDTAVPQSTLTVSGTGYGAGENVKISFDTGPVAVILVADAKGSFSGGVIAAVPFGGHTITALGATSGETHTNKIQLPATMSISPTSGPAGTTVTIDSGPGWVAGETVHVWWGGLIRKDVSADATGKVHTTYQVPTSAKPGATTFKLTDDVAGRLAQATFTVK